MKQAYFNKKSLILAGFIVTFLAFTGNSIAEELLLSYSKAEFFTKLPDIPEEIEVVTYVAGVGDISTDLLSPGADAHSRADRELHGQSIFDHNKKMQKELLELQINKKYRK